MTHYPISTSNAPKPGGPYSQAICWNQLIFTSGQVGTNPTTGKPVSEGVREQARQVLHNIQAVLKAGGSDLDHVIKTTCFLADIADFATFNEVYLEFFPSDPPARSTFQVGLVPPWRVEIEVIATLIEK